MIKSRISCQVFAGLQVFSKIYPLKTSGISHIQITAFQNRLCIQLLYTLTNNKTLTKIPFNSFLLMMDGKKIQNYITFQTKQTIFLKKNEPQMIVHEHKFQTDSLKQLLSKRSSKSKSQFFQSVFNKHEKQNQQHNEMRRQSYQKSNNLHSSHSNSKFGSKQRSYYGSKSKEKSQNQNRNNLQQNDRVKEFQLRQNLKKNKSKDKLSKKTKSMIRLPRFNDKNHFECEKSKIAPRKSYSPNRNYSEGMKKTNPNNYSNQCIKTTKFTESKQAISKNLKSNKPDKKQKKNLEDKTKKNVKSKQKSLKHISSYKGNIQTKNFTTRRKQEEAFNPFITQKQKKSSKKISPSKKIQNTKKKKDEAKSSKYLKQKMIPKKRKSMSKSKKNTHFQSVDDQLLRQNNLQSTGNDTGILNYMSSRDSFQKKVKTDRDSLSSNINRYKKKSQNASKQKQIIVSSKNINRLRNQAATKIQKVYKGYITRKWLNEYLKIINACVIIQKHWRGFRARKKLKQQKRLSKNQSLNFNLPIVQSSRTRESCMDDSRINMDKLKDILFEVMGEKSVNQLLKSKIKVFLEAEAESARSSLISRKSHNSQEKLKEQMTSERRYFQKKTKFKDQNLNLSRKSYSNRSPDSFSIACEPELQKSRNSFTKKPIMNSPQLRSRLFSPQTAPLSPKLQKMKGPESVLSNLYEIQNIQRQHIIEQAQNQKHQLNKLLHRNVCSPRSYSVKQKQINYKMQQSLIKFNQNIKGVIQSCKTTKQKPYQNQATFMQPVQQNPFSESLVLTPEHSYLKQQTSDLQDQQMISKSFQKVNTETGLNGIHLQEQMNIEINNQTTLQKMLNVQNEVPTYENFETFNINAKSSEKSQNLKPQSIKKIDTSQNFLDEYLLTMIEYMRNKNEGTVMNQIVKSLKSWRNLQPYTVLRNLSVVKDDNCQQDDVFSLPLYKYLQDDNEIIQEQYVTDYNKYFNMMKQSHKFTNQKSIPLNLSQNQPFEHYLKLLNDCFNQALNLKRPSKYMFTNRSIESFNSRAIIAREQYDIESQYEMYCASSMQEIFAWFSVKYGVSLDLTYLNQNSLTDFSSNEIDLHEQQLRSVIVQNANRLELMMKMEAQKKWDEYYETIQVIARLGEEVVEELIVAQTYTILNIQRGFMKTRELLDEDDDD